MRYVEYHIEHCVSYRARQRKHHRCICQVGELLQTWRFNFWCLGVRPMPPSLMDRWIQSLRVLHRLLHYDTNFAESCQERLMHAYNGIFLSKLQRQTSMTFVWAQNRRATIFNATMMEGSPVSAKKMESRGFWKRMILWLMLASHLRYWVISIASASSIWSSNKSINAVTSPKSQETVDCICFYSCTSSQCS